MTVQSSMEGSTIAFSQKIFRSSGGLKISIFHHGALHPPSLDFARENQFLSCFFFFFFFFEPAENRERPPVEGDVPLSVKVSAHSAARLRTV